MEQSILQLLQTANEPMRAGAIAKALEKDPKEIAKSIDLLKKTGKITSPKRCHYALA